VRSSNANTDEADATDFRVFRFFRFFRNSINSHRFHRCHRRSDARKHPGRFRRKMWHCRLSVGGPRGSGKIF